MIPRVYLPSLAELIDRLCICQLKAVFIPEHYEAYEREILLIMQDITTILDEKSQEGFIFDGKDVRAVIVLMLTNRYIWENESRARAGGSEQDKLLKLTHAINGVRSRAKNAISEGMGGDRKDHKIDCLAAETTKEFGNWNIPL